MARQLRIEMAGGFYHVLARGNEKKRIFRVLGNRDQFLSLLGRAYRRYGCLFYVYALMPNHFHLLIETKRKNLSKIMHFINVSYSVYFNRKYNRIGHLFQGRFKSIFVQKESYLLELSRYIHTNPDRAGFEGKLTNYRWTSYCYYDASRKHPPWLHVRWIIERFGRNWSTAKKEYQHFVEYGLRSTIKNPFENTYKGVILGTDNFIDETKRSSEKELNHNIASYKSLSRRHTFDNIIKITSQHFKIPSIDLFKRKRLFLPRQIAMYLIREHTDLTIKGIGEYFNVSGCAVSQNAKNISENRTAMQITRRLSKLVKNH